MSKYTTGPWTVEFNAESEFEPNIMAGDWFVAVCMDGAGDGDTEANASLIAAAPDLLEFVEYVRDQMIDEEMEEWDRVNGLIAKAKG